MSTHLNRESCEGLLPDVPRGREGSYEREHWMQMVRLIVRHYINRVVVSEPEYRDACIEQPNVVALRAYRPTHFSLIGGRDVLGIDDAWHLATSVRARWIADKPRASPNHWPVHLELRRTDVSWVIRWYERRQPAAMLPFLLEKCREELTVTRRDGNAQPPLTTGDFDNIAFSHLGMRVMDERIGDRFSCFDRRGLPRYRIDVMWQAHVPFDLWQRLHECPDLYWPTWEELKTTANGCWDGHSADFTRVLCGNVYYFRECVCDSGQGKPEIEAKASDPESSNSLGDTVSVGDMGAASR